MYELWRVSGYKLHSQEFWEGTWACESKRQRHRSRLWGWQVCDHPCPMPTCHVVSNIDYTVNWHELPQWLWFSYQDVQLFSKLPIQICFIIMSVVLYIAFHLWIVPRCALSRGNFADVILQTWTTPKYYIVDSNVNSVRNLCLYKICHELQMECWSCLQQAIMYCKSGHQLFSILICVWNVGT